MTWGMSRIRQCTMPQLTLADSPSGLVTNSDNYEKRFPVMVDYSDDESVGTAMIADNSEDEEEGKGQEKQAESVGGYNRVGIIRVPDEDRQEVPMSGYSTYVSDPCIGQVKGSKLLNRTRSELLSRISRGSSATRLLIERTSSLDIRTSTSEGTANSHTAPTSMFVPHDHIGTNMTPIHDRILPVDPLEYYNSNNQVGPTAGRKAPPPPAPASRLTQIVPLQTTQGTEQNLADGRRSNSSGYGSATVVAIPNFKVTVSGRQSANQMATACNRTAKEENCKAEEIPFFDSTVKIAAPSIFAGDDSYEHENDARYEEHMASNAPVHHVKLCRRRSGEAEKSLPNADLYPHQPEEVPPLSPNIVHILEGYHDEENLAKNCVVGLPLLEIAWRAADTPRETPCTAHLTAPSIASSEVIAANPLAINRQHYHSTAAIGEKQKSACRVGSELVSFMHSGAEASTAKAEVAKTRARAMGINQLQKSSSLSGTGGSFLLKNEFGSERKGVAVETEDIHGNQKTSVYKFKGQSLTSALKEMRLGQRAGYAAGVNRDA